MINQILIDCDGVLTDGTLTIDHNGEKLFKKFHTKDVRAIRELVANGYEVYIVSADDWPGVKKFAEKVGAEFIYSRTKDDLKFDKYIAIGDDAWDVNMLKGAKKAFCPSDADQSVLKIVEVKKLLTPGGKGVVAEMVREILG